MTEPVKKTRPDDRPAEFVAQLKLALALMSGRREVESLTAADYALLRIDTNTPLITRAQVLIAAEEILMEIVLMGVPVPPVQIDLWEVAVNLLREIATCPGGVMPPHQVRVSDDLIEQLVKEGVVFKSITGLRWGRNAARAIGRFEAEQAGTPKSGVDMRAERESTHTAKGGDWDA